MISAKEKHCSCKKYTKDLFYHMQLLVLCEKTFLECSNYDITRVGMNEEQIGSMISLLLNSICEETNIINPMKL